MQQDITNDGKIYINAEFCIVGDKLDFFEIGELMGISDYKTQEAREVRVKEFALDSWTVETGYEESTDAGEQIKKLLDRLKDKADVINEIKQRYEAQCAFIILINNYSESYPAVRYESEFIKFAANIGAEIGADY